MQDNKLIAEFMGLPLVPCSIGTENGIVYEGYQHPKGGTPFTADGLQYKYSWDWLMPVVQKCYETEIVVQPAVEGGCSGLITFPLIGLPYMESTYNAVVKFIKEYNERQ